jgi:hypothetical protein
MYTETLNDLKAVFKVGAQAGQSDTVYKTSVESSAQDEDFQKVKRRKRHKFNDTSQIAKKSTKPVPTSTAVKLLTNAVLSPIFFALLRSTESGTETTGADNALPAQEASRKTSRPPPAMMTSISNLTPLQSDLKTKSKESTSLEIHKMEPVS